MHSSFAFIKMTRFQQIALENIYQSGVVGVHISSGFVASENMSLSDTEKRFCSVNHVTCRRIAAKMADVAAPHVLYAAVATLSQAGSGFSLSFLDPAPCNKGCIFFRKYGSDRLMTVTLKDLTGSTTIMKRFMTLCCDGFEFGGRKYALLCGELPKVSKTKSNSSFTKITLKFFATHDIIDDTRYPPLPVSERIVPVSIGEVRDFLGDFTGMKAAKVNARLKLGFSSTHASLTIDNDQIVEVDDIHGGGDNIMTDGCGYISSELARSVPYAVTSGVPHSAYNTVNDAGYTVRRDGMPLPLILQVRITSGKGLFKGCLVVTSDDRLCPFGCVVVRPSMKKAPPSLHHTHDKAIVNVNDTFEKPDLLISSQRGGREVCSAHLNRDVCLLLCHLGVPKECFLDLMQDELSRVLTAHTSREGAYKAVRKAVKKDLVRYSGGGAALSEEQDEDGVFADSDGEAEENERDRGGEYFGLSPSALQLVSATAGDSAIGGSLVDPNSLFSARFNKPTSQAEMAMYFLLSGHSLDEPQLRQILRNMQLSQVSLLQRCNLRLQHSVYLVGAPDPLGVLAEGEVFVSLHDDREVITKTHTPLLVEGKVVTARNPMHHPGDIRTLTAVYQAELVQFLHGTNGGVIFFSTRGARSAADMMSGGDYDGDQFLVIYGRSDFVTSVKAVTPFAEKKSTVTPAKVNGTPSAMPSSRSQPQPESVQTVITTPPVSPSRHNNLAASRNTISPSKTPQHHSVSGGSGHQSYTNSSGIKPFPLFGQSIDSGKHSRENEGVQAALSQSFTVSCVMDDNSATSTTNSTTNPVTESPKRAKVSPGEQQSPDSLKRQRYAVLFEKNLALHRKTEDENDDEAGEMEKLHPITLFPPSLLEPSGATSCSAPDLMCADPPPYSTYRNNSTTISCISSSGAPVFHMGSHTTIASTTKSTGSPSGSPNRAAKQQHTPSSPSKKHSTSATATPTVHSAVITNSTNSKEQQLNHHNTTQQLSRGIAVSLYESASSSLVGLYCTAWRVWADITPEHDNALDCDKWSRLALDSAKTGVIVEDDPRLTKPKEFPHYMQESSSTTSVKNRKYYTSTSVLGQLYDLVQSGLRDVEAANSGGEDYLTLDADMLTVIDEYTGENIREVAMASANRVYFDLQCQWNSHYVTYKQEMACILSGKQTEVVPLAPSIITTTTGSGGSNEATRCDSPPPRNMTNNNNRHSNNNITPANGHPTTSSPSKRQQQQPVGIAHSVSSTIRSVDSTITSSSSHNSSTTNSDSSNRSGNCESLIDALKLKYIAAFDVDAVALQQVAFPTHYSHRTCRLLMATILYTATYSNAKPSSSGNSSGNSNSSGGSKDSSSSGSTGGSKKFSLSFCWEVCGTELHYLKRQQMLRKEGQSALAEMLNSERQYL